MAQDSNPSRHVDTSVRGELHQFIHLEYFADLRVNRRVWFPTKVVFAIDVLYCMQHSDAGRIEPVVGAVGEHVWPTPSHSRQLIASRLL